jgi:hypothetical protein
MRTASVLGALTEVLLAVTVILSAGMFDPASATCWRIKTAVMATRATTRTAIKGDRRAARIVAILGSPTGAGGVSAVNGVRATKAAEAGRPCGTLWRQG